MPYVPDENDRRNKLALGLLKPENVGDLNFLFTLEMIKEFKKEMRYHTIHNLCKKYVTEFVVTMSGLPLVVTARMFGFSDRDIETAARLAFMEFYSRVGRVYEDKAILKNGDLKEYQEVLQLIKTPSE
jgi:hypothetical protein